MILVDTGPLVALLDKTEREHGRVRKLVEGLAPPFVTAEPVIAEACFLLRAVDDGPRTVLRMIADGLLRTGLHIEAEARVLEALMDKYSDVPMSLADACLVRLAELNRDSAVLTFDSDFGIYRIHRKRRLDLLGLE